MPSGTGIDIFGEAFPDRTYDVGIAEQHAVTFAAGMAVEGSNRFARYIRPSCNGPMIRLYTMCRFNNCRFGFQLTAAGFVGADGATHAGSFDTAYLSCLPGFTVHGRRG